MSKINELTRRDFLLATVLTPMIAPAVMGSITSAQAQGTTSNNKRPNFLFILPDQHRFDWIGANPNLEVKTPNLDSLIARGTRFQQAFVPSPVCGPSRACLASGREYDRCGVGDNFTVYPTTQATYYEKLRDAGYYVGACGKLDLAKPTFDNGIDGRNHMSEWGFSDMVNCAGKGDAVLEWDKFKTPFEPYMAYMLKRGVADIHAADITSRGGGRAKGPEAYAKTYPTPIDDEDYADNWIGRTGIEMIRRFPKDRPWHMVVNFAGPHDPEDITQRMEKTVRGRKFPQPFNSTQLDPEQHEAIRQNYTAMVENIDRWLGIYLDELKQRGELENTIIVFSSDHGEMLGDHNRWGKNVPYDASVGVPLVVAGPNIQHRTSDALVSLIDIAATFLDYAKAEIPDGMTALSFRPLLEGRTNDHREYITSGLLNWRMVRDKRYKLIEGFDPSLMKSYGSVPKGTKRPIVLFDLQEDPNESNNIASQQPEIVASMKKRLPTRNSDPSYGFPKPEDFANYGKRS
ncbi:sulfatase-like hydrolase/transferase [Providencia rettgeri]|nr:sulfatase-like hydrolase/transferase [Providencia rettgeri]